MPLNENSCDSTNGFNHEPVKKAHHFHLLTERTVKDFVTLVQRFQSANTTLYKTVGCEVKNGELTCPRIDRTAVVQCLVSLHDESRATATIRLHVVRVEVIS